MALEVQYCQQIHCCLLFKSLMKLLCMWDKLSLTCVPRSKSMLVVKEDGVIFTMIYNLWHDDMFLYFTTNIDEGYESVVCCLNLSLFLYIGVMIAVHQSWGKVQETREETQLTHCERGFEAILIILGDVWSGPEALFSLTSVKKFQHSTQWSWALIGAPVQHVQGCRLGSHGWNWSILTVEYANSDNCWLHSCSTSLSFSIDRSVMSLYLLAFNNLEPFIKNIICILVHSM